MRFEKLAYLSVSSGTTAALIATLGAPVAAALLAAVVITVGVSPSSDGALLTIVLTAGAVMTALASGRGIHRLLWGGRPATLAKTCVSIVVTGIWLRFLLALAGTLFPDFVNALPEP
jgi:hypothetical protein